MIRTWRNKGDNLIPKNRIVDKNRHIHMNEFVTAKKKPEATVNSRKKNWKILFKKWLKVNEGKKKKRTKLKEVVKIKKNEETRERKNLKKGKKNEKKSEEKKNKND